MEFIETPLFTKSIQHVMSDDDLRQLQMSLSLYPSTGRVIPGSGGLRKIRWVGSGKGKRGGLRVIYYWIVSQDQIYLLYAYKKSQQEDLTSEQLKSLKDLVEE